MVKIKEITARQILSSSGYPTIEGRLLLDDGHEIVSSVPADYFSPPQSAVELRDNDSKYQGKAVSRAVYYINKLIAPKLKGISPLKQLEIDSWLVKADGTANMNQIGVNTILTVSQLLVKAGSYSESLPLYQYLNSFYKKYYQPDFSLNKFPSAIYTLIKGRKKKESNLDFDKFLIAISSSIPFSQSLQIGFNIYNKLHQDFQVYDLATNIDAIEAIVQSATSLNYKLGKEIFFGLDLKASNLEKNGLYHIRDRGNPLRIEDYFSYLDSMINRYAFLILIDPLTSQDIDSWSKFNQKISKDVYLVGNDLTYSNQEKIKKVITDKAVSAFVIKTHQAGTIKKVFDLVKLAKENGLSYIFSSGSEETNDSIEADLAYGLQADFVSFGPPHGGENVAKYNRMLEIEKEMRSQSTNES